MRYIIKILAYFILTLAIVGFAVFLFQKNQPLYASLSLAAAAIIIWLPFRSLAKRDKEFYQFVEDIRYRDFTRNYDIRKGSPELQKRHKAFNELNEAYGAISAERETHFIYLQRVLEMVSAGILTYDINSGEIIWINEATKQLFGIPQIKNIEWINSRNKYLYDALSEIEIGESKIIDIPIGLNSVKVLTNLSGFQSDGKFYKLFAFQNVRDALEEAESTAWKRLLSVMTHEIMNSVAPISSLADTLSGNINRLKGAPGSINDFAFDDLTLGIETIKRRSDGLFGFAQAYRSLNKTIELNISNVYIEDLFDNLYRLMAPGLERKGIRLEVEIKEPVSILHIDRRLMEQVIINLITNAADAVREKPDARISLFASTDVSGKAILKVIDNGNGIPPDLLDKIFIPFFSTKKKGSGIGLSLSRQIVQRHKGGLRVRTEEGKGSVFTISL
ncbi:MAG: HAMP domain-containing histidine kinase [Prevotellaceae bacterium]|jgi:signal transduction histidine kinase|nr:HAMP domain-containing histidine kinase [Prevotellaceae bacterium]